MRGPWVILVDGDDSIWDCNIYFRRTDETCIGFLQSLWPDGPTDEEILTLRRVVHRARLRKRGFSLHCFQDAWIETYRQLSHYYHRPFDPAAAEVLWQIGEVPLQAQYSLFPGVIEAFAQFRERGHTLHLLTTGDDAFQRAKVTRNGLDRYIGQTHVVQYGKEGVMWSYAKRHQRVIMAGDSIERDILTARQIGLEAAWISTPHGDSHPFSQPNGDGYHVITHISDLLPILDYLPLRSVVPPHSV